MGRRIGGAGGGSDPGKKSGGGLIVAGALVVVLGAGGAGAAGSLASSAASGSSAGSSSSSGGRSSTKAKDADTVTARLTARGIKARANLSDGPNDCAAHSYGQVHDYLVEHPCRALLRSLIEVYDSRGDVALVAVASVEMPNEEQARELRALMDSPGTGNITEISREKGRYQSVRYTGLAYDSRQNGSVLTNAQVQPVARGWTGLALTTIATNAVI